MMRLRSDRLNTARAREAIAGYAFIAPAALLFIVFVLVPTVGALGLSFFDWNFISDPVFVGIENFGQLIADPLALRALANTAVFTVVSVVLHVVIGLGLALGANRVMPGPVRYFLRTAYFLPVVLSWTAVAMIWGFMFDPSTGIFNWFLETLGLDPPNWLVTPGWAMAGIILVSVWHTVGFSVIVLLAGLQSLPEEVFDAAKIDGAGPARRLWSLTLPLLSPSVLFVTIIAFIAAVQVFDPIYIMTRGGPNESTLSIVMYIFNKGFRQYDMGYAAALSTLTLVALLLATLAQLRLSRRWVFYDN